MIFHPPEKFGYLGTPPPDTAVYIRPGSTAVHVAVDKPRIYNTRKIYHMEHHNIMEPNNHFRSPTNANDLQRLEIPTGFNHPGDERDGK